MNSKNLVRALVLVTILSLSFGQTAALAWHGHHSYGHYRSHRGSFLGGLLAATVATAIIESASRPAPVVAPVAAVPEAAPTTFVDAYGRLVVVRNVYDPATGQIVPVATLAR